MSPAGLGCGVGGSSCGILCRAAASGPASGDRAAVRASTQFKVTQVHVSPRGILCCKWSFQGGPCGILEVLDTQAGDSTGSSDAFLPWIYKVITEANKV